MKETLAHKFYHGSTKELNIGNLHKEGKNIANVLILTEVSLEKGKKKRLGPNGGEWKVNYKLGFMP